MADQDSPQANPNGQEPAPAGGAQTPPESTAGKQYTWQRGTSVTPALEDPAAAAAQRKQRKLFTLLGTLLAVAAVVAGLLLWVDRPAKPYLLVIPVTEYVNHRYPVNALAEQDSQALRRQFGAAESKEAHFTSQTRESLVRLIEQNCDLAQGKPLVIHLSCHARTWQGKVYLLTGEADPDQPDTWLPLDRVLKVLEQKKKTQVLLLLDITRPMADPRLGVLLNDVPDRLDKALEPYLRKDFLVLCPCSPGQTDVVAEDLGQSIFVHYLILGLKGAAAGYEEGRSASRITARDLAGFVRDQVSRWAWENRGVRQRPQLYGQGDFQVAVVSPGQDQAAEPPPDQETAAAQGAEAAVSDSPGPPAYPDWLLKGWQMHDRWSQDETYRLAPLATRLLEAHLLRAEQRWRGGEDEQVVRKDWQAGLRGPETRVARARDAVLRAVEPHSLARLAQGKDASADKQVTDPLRVVLKEVLAGTPKPEGVKKARDEFLKKTGDKPPYDTVACAAFEIAAGDPDLTRDKLQFLLELQEPPRFLEFQYLARLARLWKEQGAELKPGVARLFLRVVRDVERVGASDPAVLPALRRLLEPALRERQEGERLLLAADADLDQAEAHLKNAQTRLEKILGFAETLEKTLRTYDRAFMVLPAVQPYVLGRAEAEPDWLARWQDAVEHTETLGKKLDQCRAGLARDDEFSQVEEELRQARSVLEIDLGGTGRDIDPPGLEQPFQKPHVEQLLKSSQAPDAGPADYRQIQLLLATPLLLAEDRVRLWQAGWELSRRWQEKGVDSSHPDRRGGKPLESTEMDSVAERRAGLALAVARLAGTDASLREPLEQALDRARKQRADPGAWEKLGDGLRRLWAQQLPDLVQERLRRQDLPGAARLTRVLNPFDLDAATGPLAALEDPTSQLRRHDAVDFWQWQARQYQAESRNLKESEELHKIYEQMAEDYLRLTHD